MTKAPLRSSASSRPLEKGLMRGSFGRSGSAGRSGDAALVDEARQPRLVILALQPLGGGGGLGLEILAAIHRSARRHSAR